MHEVPLLINITLALVVAFIGGVIARRLGLPTIVGYLLAGIAIGPFTPGFVGDVGTIRQLADLGVVFLLFGAGLNFSLADLWRVRDIAIPGAVIQAAFTSLLGFALSQLWGWSLSAGLILGFAISVSSTVVLLRGVMDHSLLNTSHGQAALGWTVMEDLISVTILLFLPILSSGPGALDPQQLAVALLKAVIFVLLMGLAGVRLIPWILERTVHTRSRELFILAVLAISLGTALGASQLFGVSLALGAFMAGAIISQSHLSHQVGADVLSFREAFSVLFFVSVGILVNPAFLLANLGQVISIGLLVVVVKAVNVILLGLIFPRPAKTFLVIAVGVCQIGEFSFILGQTGMSLQMLDANQYSLLLAASLISIALNPFMFRLLPFWEKTLRRIPSFWRRLDKGIHIPEILPNRIQDHVVIVGFGRVGSHLVDVLELLKVPLLVIEADPERLALLNRRKIPALYGDVANSEIITRAHLEDARALVVTVPEETTAMLVVTAARDLCPTIPIIARAITEPGVRELSGLGATRVVHPELEGGLELVHHTLLSLGFPLRQVHEYIESIRRDRYDTQITTDREYQSLHDLLYAIEGIEITWLELEADSPLIGKTLTDANVRSRSGASVVALIRNGKLAANPKSMTVFETGDRIGLIGEDDQIETARRIIEPPPDSNP
jgi:CPA2 family monovalent cation:H+ antiporter-2